MKERPTKTISMERYVQLLSAEKELQCLNDAGVDNWEGCGDAFRDVGNGQAFWEWEEEIQEKAKKGEL
jgi:hypothetical protein